MPADVTTTTPTDSAWVEYDFGVETFDQDLAKGLPGRSLAV